MTAYDVIGDIHGSADKLAGLLSLLGYRVVDGAHRHPGRQAVFVGDLVDRGDAQVEVVRLVRAMHDAGSALVTMGNHEFNALAFATPDPGRPGDFLRTHQGRRGAHNRALHQGFLDQFAEGSARYHDCIDWFRSLPLRLDLGGIRIAHACWHAPSFAVLDKWVVPDTPVTDEFLVEATTKGTDVFEAVEVVLKGPEMHLAPEWTWQDPEGTIRRTARLRWWDAHATTLRSIAVIPSDTRTPDGEPFPGLPDVPYGEADTFRYRDPVPVFFGHYWFDGTPAPASTHAVCVDYSAVRPGRSLVAYRWDGETVPTAANFVGFPGH